MPFLSLLKKGELLENGKEDSYERNPGGVSFVLNLSFQNFLSSEKLARAVERFFRQPENGMEHP